MDQPSVFSAGGDLELRQKAGRPGAGKSVLHLAGATDSVACAWKS